MTAEQAVLKVLAWIASVIAVGGGSTVLAFYIFRTLGKSWLDQHFEKQLEQFKHERQTEIEQLRHQINALFSRISKIHEKEFEILPKAWQLLHEAYGAVFEVVKSLKQFPDFARMSEPQFEEFLKTSRVAEFQKDELRSSKERDKCYREAIFWRQLDDAKRAHTQLNNYLAVNSIFMTETMREQFRTINGALITVLIIEETNHGQGYSEALVKSRSESLAQSSDLFGKIESAVQKRLRYEDA